MTPRPSRLPFGQSHPLKLHHRCWSKPSDIGTELQLNTAPTLSRSCRTFWGAERSTSPEKVSIGQKKTASFSSSIKKMSGSFIYLYLRSFFMQVWFFSCLKHQDWLCPNSQLHFGWEMYTKAHHDEIHIWTTCSLPIC